MIDLYISQVMTLFNSRKRLKRLQKECTEALKDYVKKNDICKLQIGTGPNKLIGWFNTDISPSQEGIYHLDASRSFPNKMTSFTGLCIEADKG